MTTDPGASHESLPHEPTAGDELTPAELAALAWLHGPETASGPDNEELTATQLAALARLDDGPLGPGDDDPYGAGFGPGTCPPDGWELMSAAEQQALLDSRPAPAVPEVLAAGFTHRDGGPGLGFAAGGVLDQMEPGELLTLFADRAWGDGLGRLSDDELCGLLAAQRRLASRAAAAELAATAELAARRAGPDGRPGEHVAEEVAALLTLTGRAAAGQLDLAGGLARLPGAGRRADRPAKGRRVRRPADAARRRGGQRHRRHHPARRAGDDHRAAARRAGPRDPRLRPPSPDPPPPGGRERRPPAGTSASPNPAS